MITCGLSRPQPLSCNAHCLLVYSRGRLWISHAFLDCVRLTNSVSLRLSYVSTHSPAVETLRQIAYILLQAAFRVEQAASAQRPRYAELWWEMRATRENYTAETHLQLDDVYLEVRRLKFSNRSRPGAFLNEHAVRQGLVHRRRGVLKPGGCTSQAPQCQTRCPRRAFSVCRSATGHISKSM